MTRTNAASDHFSIGLDSETAPLHAVIVGIGTSQGPPLPIDPVSIRHIRNGTYPREEDVIRELDAFGAILQEEGVRVFRPENLEGVNQIFSRDIGLVIDDKFVVAGMRKEERRAEIKGIEHLLDQIDSHSIVRLPEGAYLEGGDVVLYHDYVFVGLSDRTNMAGCRFLQEQFPGKNVVPLKLVVSDDPDANNLHLDCVFQPVGVDKAVMYPDGFAKTPADLFDLFPEGNRYEVSVKQKNRLCTNFFSVSPELVVLERSFNLVNEQFQQWGIDTRLVDFQEVSKQGGLLRCSTLPLKRV